MDKSSAVGAKKMNKHERIRAALRGDEVDAVPSAFWLHFPRPQSFGAAAIEAHLEFYRDTDVDVLKVMNEALYLDHGFVTSPTEWSRWKPVSARSPHFQRMLDVLKAVSDRLSDEVPILATIHGAFISAFHGSKRHPKDTILSPNVITDHLRESPESVVPALRVVSESLVELSLACLEAGATGIYYGAQGGEAHRFTESTFLDFVKPWDLFILRELRKHTDVLVLHICKDRIRLPLYADYPCDAVNWAVHDSDYTLEDGRRLFGKTILGGFDDRSGVLIDGDRADIERDVDNVLASFGRRGLILGADCTMPTDIPRWRIRTAVDAARSR